MHREVCLKHRKNRRETILRARRFAPKRRGGVCSFCRQRRGHFGPRRIGGHRSRAGCLGADQAMPVKLRLITYLLKTHNVAAGASLRSSVSKSLHARGGTEEEEGNNGGRMMGEQSRRATFQSYRWIRWSDIEGLVFRWRRVLQCRFGLRALKIEGELEQRRFLMGREQGFKDALQATSVRSVTEPVHHFIASSGHE